MRLAKDIFSPAEFWIGLNSLLECFVIAAKIIWNHLRFQTAFFLSG